METLVVVGRASARGTSSVEAGKLGAAEIECWCAR